MLFNTEYELTLTPKNQDASNSLKSGLGVVEFDINIDEDLYIEGLARDIIRHIQQSRKEAGFEINDKIELEITTQDKLKDAINIHQNFIETQTLSLIKDISKYDYSSTGEIEGYKFEIKMFKQ